MVGQGQAASTIVEQNQATTPFVSSSIDLDALVVAATKEALRLRVELFALLARQAIDPTNSITRENGNGEDFFSMLLFTTVRGARGGSQRPWSIVASRALFATLHSPLRGPSNGASQSSIGIESFVLNWH